MGPEVGIEGCRDSYLVYARIVEPRVRGHLTVYKHLHIECVQISRSEGLQMGVSIFGGGEEHQEGFFYLHFRRREL